MTCLNDAEDNLGLTLGRFFVEYAFSAKAKNLGDQIISDIKKAFIARLNTLDWMEDGVKKLAVEKVNKITQKIGYQTKACSPTPVKPLSSNVIY